MPDRTRFAHLSEQPAPVWSAGAAANPPPVIRPVSNGRRSRAGISEHLQQTGLERLDTAGPNLAVSQASLLGRAGDRSLERIAALSAGATGRPVRLESVVPEMAPTHHDPDFAATIVAHLDGAVAATKQAGLAAGHAAGEQAAYTKADAIERRYGRNTPATHRQILNIAVARGVDVGVRAGLRTAAAVAASQGMAASLDAMHITAGEPEAFRVANQAMPAAIDRFAGRAVSSALDAARQAVAHPPGFDAHHQPDTEQRLLAGLAAGIDEGLRYTAPVVADTLEAGLKAGWEADKIKPAGVPQTLGGPDS